MNSKKNLYLICSGTTKNDIIDSINNNYNKYNKKSIFNFFLSKGNDKKKSNSSAKSLNKSKTSILDVIGIKELYLCQENNKNKKFLNDTGNIYSSLDYSTIESTFVLFESFKNTTIYPLPYMANNTNLTADSLNRMKRSIGDYDIDNNTTEVKNYWNGKMENRDIGSNLSAIKNFISTINWKFPTEIIKTNKSSINTYNFKNFERILHTIILNESPYEDTFIFVVNSDLLVDMLKSVKSFKYNKKEDIIERSSVWNFTLDVDLNNNRVTYTDVIKSYPTEYNYEPLKRNRDTYQYSMFDKNFILFNSRTLIPLQYLKNMSFKSFSNNQKNTIKSILFKKKEKSNNKNNVNKNNSNNMNNNKNKKNSTTVKKYTFENLI